MQTRLDWIEGGKSLTTAVQTQKRTGDFPHIILAFHFLSFKPPQKLNLVREFNFVVFLCCISIVFIAVLCRFFERPKEQSVWATLSPFPLLYAPHVKRKQKMWRESQLLTWMGEREKESSFNISRCCCCRRRRKRHFKEHSQWDNAQIRIIFSGYIIDN